MQTQYSTVLCINAILEDRRTYYENKKIKKSLLTLLTISMLIFSINTITASEIASTPIMENYGVKTDDIYIPKLPELLDIPQQTTLTYYNPLSSNKTTDVKSQGKQGTCSIFATNAALETTGLYKTGLKYSMSEEAMRFVLSDQLSYANNLFSFFNDFYFIGASDGRDIDITSTYITSTNNQIIYQNSLSWKSPNLSKDVPYTDISYDDTNKKWPSNMDTSYSSYYASKTRYINSEEIKDYILSSGAVYTTFYADQVNGLNHYTNAFYTDINDLSKHKINHAVCVVGWNDNYEINNFLSSNQPSKKGAWLVKNSWGTANANNGYYWISYDDKTFNYYNNAFVIEKVDNVSKNEHMLAYDYMPMTGTLDCNVGDKDYIYMTNVYDVTDLSSTYGEINKVMFYTNEMDSMYRIYIVALKENENLPNATELNNPLYSGYINAEGYTTVELLNPFTFNADTEKIAVIIKLVNDNCNGSFQLSGEKYSAKHLPKCSPGESYIYIYIYI